MHVLDGAVKHNCKWTEEQSDIIHSSPDARLLVEAGPGTGKTAVACARVASLVDQGVATTKIGWLMLPMIPRWQEDIAA